MFANTFFLLKSTQEWISNFFKNLNPYLLKLIGRINARLIHIPAYSRLLLKIESTAPIFKDFWSFNWVFILWGLFWETRLGKRVRSIFLSVRAFVTNTIISTAYWVYYLLFGFVKQSLFTKGGLFIIFFFAPSLYYVEYCFTTIPNPTFFKAAIIPDLWIQFFCTKHTAVIVEGVFNPHRVEYSILVMAVKLYHTFLNTSVLNAYATPTFLKSFVIFDTLYAYFEYFLQILAHVGGDKLIFKNLALTPFREGAKLANQFGCIFYTNSGDLQYLAFLNNPESPRLLFGFFLYALIFFVLSVSLSFLFINKLGLYGSFILTTTCLSIFWLSALLSTFFVWTNNLSCFTSYGKWFNLTPTLTINFDFYFDNLSMSFALLVLSIAFFINVYTFAYFRYEPNVTRLILFIDVFVVSMVLLVTGGNFIIFYFGWEMIGITSFFLINFWSTRMGTVKASFKAFTFNKISDCCILLGLTLIYVMFGDLNIVNFNESISLHTQTEFRTVLNKYPAINSLTYCFMIAAFIKSAQFGFHIWLPDSMEAPVPASALIHSATLVSAGVFLILRVYPLFELSPFARVYIIFFGSLTALFGGVCSIFQTDVKRLLAYSTISHCGVLMFLTFFKNPDITIIYLYVHGFFKAVIFMCMGHVIRFANNHQDMRRMGGFYKYLPFEAFLSLVALINLGGVSFTLGYYMKHFLFVESTPESQFNLFCYTMVVFGSLCGLIYSYKLYYYVFFDFKKARKHVYLKQPNNFNKNYYYTNASLASNIAITGLTLTAYILCSYLICKYMVDHSAHFDWSYFNSSKGDLKNFTTTYFTTIYFYINWFIILLISFLLFNNWKNKIDASFKIKFFSLFWVYLFFFYIFYSILII